MPTLGGRAGAAEAAHGAYLTCLSEMERNREGSPGKVAASDRWRVPHRRFTRGDVASYSVETYLYFYAVDIMVGANFDDHRPALVGGDVLCLLALALRTPPGPGGPSSRGCVASPAFGLREAPGPGGIFSGRVSKASGLRLGLVRWTAPIVGTSSARARRIWRRLFLAETPGPRGLSARNEIRDLAVFSRIQGVQS